MKKIFIVALFILGMCNASAFGMAHEIILTKLYGITNVDFTISNQHMTITEANRK